MDKKHLQHNILESAYNQESWHEVLKEYFGVKTLHQSPRPIDLSPNDLSESAFELGSFLTADERLVGIYHVNLTYKPDIFRNRVGLRNLLRQVYKYDVDAALIVFVQHDKWRFSYVSEIRTEQGKKETEPKRYSYLFGKNEICRTAADRFDKLKGKPLYLNDLFDAFSVDKLNKDFFKAYKEHYEKFWKYLVEHKKYYNLFIDKSQDDEDKRQKPIRDFVKKLLGRIVFLHFLQKKGWMGVPISNNEQRTTNNEWTGGDIKFLQTLFANHPNKSQFHSTALKTLFFETLNTKRPNDLAPENLISDFRTTNDEQRITKIPYLNGGLFDRDISFDNDIDFPEDYFHDLLDFFEQYNFTIDENDPYDNEVGIDPEMLGHIFENLLEENREKGAFYTPKEIVHYMCHESLIQYLKTNYQPSKNTDSTLNFELETLNSIDFFVRKNQLPEPFTHRDNAIKLNNLLKDVKICDPAIGSGAFPMGMLKEIFECRRLLYPYLKTNEAFDPAIIKKEIIQNNIYGVDLDPGAVDIARLRFWLALVVDETVPQPLPNLDYKIMQGNSLLEQFDIIDLKFERKAFQVKLVKEVNLFGEAVNPQISITEYLQTKQDLKEFDITELEDKYFNNNSYEEKLEIRNKIEAFEKSFIQERLDKHIKELKTKLQQQKAEFQKHNSTLNNTSEAKTTAHKNKHEKAVKGNERKSKEIDKLENEITRLELKLDEFLKLASVSKPYFLWHLYFLDVFEKGGFDIVIGNPPYIQLQRMGVECDDLEIASYNTFNRTGDIYCLFYELGNNILKSKGNLCFITSNKWMNSAYGKSFRNYLLQETNPILLIDFSKAVIFPAAVVFVNILQFINDKINNELWGVKAQSDFQIGKIPLNEYVKEHKVKLTNLNDENWSVSDKLDFDITNAIDVKGKPLKNWEVQFYAGIKTAMNPAFHIDLETKSELINEDAKNEKIIKPLLRGKDVKRWAYHFENLYIINSHNGIREKNIQRINVKKDFPVIYKHLLQYYDKDSPKAVKNPDGTFQTLKDRQDQGDHWTNLRNCAFIEEFEKEKIVWIEISDRANYCIDTNGYYLTNSAYFLTGKNLRYLLGLLNSKIMDFYFFQKTAQIAGGRKRYTKQYVELLPIPQIEEKLMKPFEIIVDYLINLNDKNNSSLDILMNMSTIFEEVLNMMIYELYFEEHMKQKEIDVLQFIDTKKIFKDISQLDNDEAKKDIIVKAYQWLRQPDNPILSCISLAPSRSPDIIARINNTTK